MVIMAYCPWRAKTNSSPDPQVAVQVKDVIVKTSKQAEQEIAENLDAARVPQLDVEVQHRLQATWDDFDYALGLSMVYGPCLLNVPLLIASSVRIATKAQYRPNNQLDFRALLKIGPGGKPSYIRRLRQMLAAGFIFQIAVAAIWSFAAASLIAEQRRQERKTCDQEGIESKWVHLCDSITRTQAFTIVLLSFKLLFVSTGIYCIGLAVYHASSLIGLEDIVFGVFTVRDGKRVMLQHLVNEHFGDMKRVKAEEASSNKFVVAELMMGKPDDSALGIVPFLGVDEAELYQGMAQGVLAIVSEFEKAGTEEDLYCLNYVLHGKTGSDPRKFANGTLDDGRPAGLTLSDFKQHQYARMARLSDAHVLALRLYTTAAFKSLNRYLRTFNSSSKNHDDADTGKKKFPVTACFIDEGLRRLRVVEANIDRANANKPLDLWRGLNGVRSSDSFVLEGGTEFGVLSTTRSIDVALTYSYGHGSGAADEAMILKLRTDSFLQRGASLGFLSAFPAEDEWCYPPLTFLMATGLRHKIVAPGGTCFDVIEVVPILAA